jgi:predicted enzyme related to lactoylglutathione lyase
MSGRFVWQDLMTSDPDKATTFYTSLFGWTIVPQDMQGYTYNMIHVGETGIGGITQLDPTHGLPTHWMTYLHVPGSLDDSAAKITELGGTIVQPPFDIPGVGRMAVATDPQGAFFSPFEPTDMVVEAPTYPVPGGGVAWHELLTTDTAGAAAFYTGITGLSSSVQDMGTGPYTLLQEGENDYRAGILPKPDMSPVSAWLVYFEIAQDTMEDALAEVKRLGGEVAMGPMEIPTVGVIGVVSDPTGGVIGLMKSASA